ncbi:hypothetical protein WMZ97_03355 [Lentibacillus sp. N15]|uniref:hypothetical protein n=1 Tax=Lentibacillus songyuanensis TaxID=3136161 RepID=UPI0031BA0913
MSRTAMMLLILIIYTVYAAWKHRTVWRRLTVIQTFKVVITFIIMCAIGGTFLYLSSRTLTDVVPNEMISIIIEFIVAIIMIGFGVVIFNIIVSRITNGILPVNQTSK